MPLPINNTDPLIARPVIVYHQDGSQQTVYLMEVPANNKKKTVGDHVRENAIVCYFMVGTFALGLGMILSFRQLKNSNG